MLEMGCEHDAAAGAGMARFLASDWYKDIIPEVFAADDFRVEGGRLLKKLKGGTYAICLLESEVPKALQQAHDSALGGHYGKEVTLKRLEGAFWWPSMKQDVGEWVRKCMRCAQTWTSQGLLK